MTTFSTLLHSDANTILYNKLLEPGLRKANWTFINFKKNLGQPKADASVSGKITVIFRVFA